MPRSSGAQLTTTSPQHSPKRVAAASSPGSIAACEPAARGERDLGQRDCETAVGDVVGRGEHAVARELAEQVAEPAQCGQVDLGNAAGARAGPQRLPFRAVVGRRSGAEREQRAARVGGRGGHGRVGPLQHPDAADDGRRVDRPASALVVERHVAGHDRRAEHLAGLGHARDRLAQRIRGARALGVAEVEAVRDRRGLRAAAGDVEHRLGDGLGAAAPRVERDARAVAVQRDGDPALGRRQAHDAGVAARAGDGARAHDLVVLLVDPGLGADVGRGQQRQQQRAGIGDRRHLIGARARARTGLRAARRGADSAGASASASAGMSPTSSPS